MEQAGTQQIAETAERSRPRRGLDLEARKRLFCRTLLDSFDPFKPAVIAWPKLDKAALERLTNLPFWDVAVATEGQAAARIDALARVEGDALLREAVALQSFEESRHKQVLEAMLAHYEIPIGEESEYVRPKDAEWGFLRMGYGECFDSFFAFGLFKLARDSGFFPPTLVEVFEPVIQEEARHILFFVNWVDYARRRQPWWRRPFFRLRCLAAIVIKAIERARLGGNVDSSNFTSAGQSSVAVKITPRAFLLECLRENERRLGGYDARLLRPRIVPAMARLALVFMPRGTNKSRGGA